MKRRLGAGELTLRDVLADPEELLLGMTIGELLCSLPRWGPTRMRKLLGSPRVRAGETKALRELTPRQRAVILDLVG